MGYIQKHAKLLSALLALSIFYFLLRFYNILSLPIFTDEAIYVRWAQIAKNDAAWRFISLTDGKQPLFVWFAMILMKFITDPLLAGRTASVLSGFMTMIGLFFLGREVFKNTKIGLLSALLYVIYPFALVYDRMALYDSLVGTFAVWGLFGVILLVRYVRLDIAMTVGILSGIGALNKTSSFFTLYLLPFAFLLFDWSGKKVKSRFVKLLGLSVLVVIFTFAIYSLLRLSPFFHIIEQKNAIFVYPLREWITHPFRDFYSNFWVGMRDWFVTYFNLPFLILMIASFFIKKTFMKEKIVLFIWFAAPFVALGLFGRTLYPRYILFMTLSLLPLVAYSLYELFFIIKNKMLYLLLFVLIFVLPIYTNVLIVTNFAKAPIPSSDINQYNNDWPSGDGITESITFLKTNEKSEKVALYTQGTFGLLPYAYEVYLYNDPQFVIKGLWPISNEMPEELVQSAAAMPTYVVFYQPCPSCPDAGKAPATWQVEPVFEKLKVNAPRTLTLYKVKAQ